MTVVLKFGGTSLRDHPYQVLNRVLNAIKRHGEQVVVVVSALAGVTDALLNHDLLGASCILNTWKQDHRIHNTVFATILPVLDFAHRCSAIRNRSLFVSLGEKMSAVLFSELLCMYGASAVPIWADVSLLQCQRDNVHCDPRRLHTSHAKNCVPVVTGYCAFDAERQHTCLLGRNGSDTTATILAKTLNCNCVIFSDVQAIMTVDPRLCKKARPVHRMTFDEVRELAFHGASILHGDCIEYAEDNGNHTLTVAHVSDNCWKKNGTVLTHELVRLSPTRTAIAAMAVLENRVGISVRAKRGVVGFACQIFQRVCGVGVSVEMFSQTCSERSICLLVPASAETKVVDALQDYNVTCSEDLCIITVVGELMRDTPGVAAEVCSALADHGINIRCMTQGATEMSLSVAVAQSDLGSAVEAVHSCLQ